MRKRNRILLLCCFSLIVFTSSHAQKNTQLQNEVLAISGDQNELYIAASNKDGTYYDLGCKHQGLDGYFAPDRWSKTIEFAEGNSSGTEKPNSRVVEEVTGDRILIVKTESSNRYTWWITVPADGYLYFRLKKAGHGKYASQRISSTAGDLHFYHDHDKIEYRPLRDGGCYSPHLKAGDVFGICFNGKEREYEWANFTFYSNSVGVIVDVAGQCDPSTGLPLADNVRPVMRVRIDQLFFPSDAPEVWPHLDQDGDFTTLDDQIELKSFVLSENTTEAQQPLLVDHQDRIEKRDGQYWILRQFTFTEPCSGNVVSIDRKWRPLPIVPNVIDVR